MGTDYELHVNFKGLTKAQVITLQAYFGQWQQFSRIGHSTFTAFYVDGDGNFHPKIDMTVKPDLDLTEERLNQLKECCHPKSAEVKVDSSDAFDFDNVAWAMTDKEED